MTVNTPGALLQQYAVREFDSAIRALSCPLFELAAGVHKARKALRRAVAVLDLGRKRLARSRTSVRSRAKAACRSLAPLRDADAVVETLDKEIERHESKSKIRKLKQLRSKLSARRSEMLRIVLDEDPHLLGRRQALRLLREEVRALPWETIMVRDIHRAVSRSKHRAGGAKKKAAKRESHAARHRWRRRLRCLVHQLEAVEWASSRCPALAIKSASLKKLINRTSALGRERDLQMLRIHSAIAGGR